MNMKSFDEHWLTPPMEDKNSVERDLPPSSKVSG